MMIERNLGSFAKTTHPAINAGQEIWDTQTCRTWEFTGNVFPQCAGLKISTIMYDADGKEFRLLSKTIEDRLSKIEDTLFRIEAILSEGK